MSFNIDSFKQNYPCIDKRKGIDFSSLRYGSLTPRAYFTEQGAPILITLTERKVEITPNAQYSLTRLSAEMKRDDTVSMIYRTRQFEGSKPFTDLYARHFVVAALGFLMDNGNHIQHWEEEWNSGSTNYIRYVGAIEGGADPILAISATWGATLARSLGFATQRLETAQEAWQCGSKIKVLYSR